jgi:dihydrofolate reductase
VHGSRTLIRWLLDNGLVDEITLLAFPVTVGQGTRLFADTGPDRALELVESRATPSAVTTGYAKAIRGPRLRSIRGRSATRVMSPPCT